MRTVMVTNRKGGSCKTTTAVNLAAALAELGHRVLFVDLDPDGHGSRYLGVKEESKDLMKAMLVAARMIASGKEIPSGSLTRFVRPSSAPGVDIVPSCTEMDFLEEEMEDQAQVMDRETRRQALRPLVRGLPPDWDFVFIDPPPSYGYLMAAGLRATEEVLAPLEVSSMSIDGIRKLLLTTRAMSGINQELGFTGIIACRVQVVGNTWTRVAKELIGDLRQHNFLGPLVFNHVIRESTRLREVQGHGLPITVWEPNGNGATDHRAVAAELLTRTPRRIAVRKEVTA